MLAMHRDGLITLPPPRQRPSRRKPIVFGTGHRTTAVRASNHPRRGTASRRLHRRQRHPGRKAVERVRRPLPLSGIHNPGRRPDALRRPRPQRMARRHARLLHRRMETRAARHPHRMDTRGASEEPATSSSTTRASSSCPGFESTISGPTSSPSCDDACPVTGPGATTPRRCS